MILPPLRSTLFPYTTLFRSGDNGLHGFSIPIPPGAANGLSHTLQVRYETSATQLSGSPVTLTWGTTGGGGGRPRTSGIDAPTACLSLIMRAADKNRLNTTIL